MIQYVPSLLKIKSNQERGACSIPSSILWTPAWREQPGPLLWASCWPSLNKMHGRGGSWYKQLKFWCEGERSPVSCCLLPFSCPTAFNYTMECCCLVVRCNHWKYSCVLFVRIIREVRSKPLFSPQYNTVLPGSSSWPCSTKIMPTFFE